MNNGAEKSPRWPKVRLGEVLRHRKEFITIDDLTNYKRPRVQLHVQGIVLRDEVPGALIKTKSQQVCRMGEFLVAEIDAKVGGFGIVPESLNGSLVSSHYFLFDIDEAKLDRRFLDFFIRTPAFREQVAAQGSTNYAAIRPAHVLGYEIPLPPLVEQRRVVARIEELATQIHEARTLRHQSAEEAEALTHSSLRAKREALIASDLPKSRLGSIARVTSGGTPSRDNPAFWGGKIPWIKTGELLDGDIYAAEECITQDGVDGSSAKVFPPETILVALYGQGQTRGRTGRLKIPAATNQACCAILPKLEQLEPKFVQLWLRSLYVELREKAQGGAQPNWNGAMIKNLEVAIPPLPEQRRIVSELNGLQAEVDTLKRLQAETAAELDALLPAILDRAFKGELR
jgi:type I restriction enzyme S subunit